MLHYAGVFVRVMRGVLLFEQGPNFNVRCSPKLSTRCKLQLLLNPPVRHELCLSVPNAAQDHN